MIHLFSITRMNKPAFGLTVAGMLSIFLCGCQGGSIAGFNNPFGGGTHDTVLLGDRTLDPSVSLVAVPVRSTRGSEPSKLGIAYLKRGDYKRAADTFDQASTINPEDHNSVFLAGLSYEKLGNQPKACTRYSQAARIEYISKYLDGEQRTCDRG